MYLDLEAMGVELLIQIDKFEEMAHGGDHAFTDMVPSIRLGPIRRGGESIGQ